MFRGLKFTAVLMVFLSLPVFVSCSTQYGAYSKEIYTGKKLLEEKEYEKSKELFSQASRDQRNSTSLEMHDILSMIAKQTADMAILDATIEKQIIWYENEMDNWNSGVPSYFSDKFGRPM